MKVLCCKATEECLEFCLHAKPHEPDINNMYGSCTKWGECVPKNSDESIKARCTKVKENI